MPTREKFLLVLAAVEVVLAAVAAWMQDWVPTFMLLALTAAALFSVRDLRRTRLSGSAGERAR